MKTIFKAILYLGVFGNAALAEGSHGSKHAMAIGQPGHNHINRSLTVKMFETENSMAFTPEALSIKKGQTVKIHLINNVDFEHEFVMGTKEGIQKHKVLMEDLSLPA